MGSLFLSLSLSCPSCLCVMNNSISFHFLTSAISPLVCLAEAHIPALFHSDTPPSLSLEFFPPPWSSTSISSHSVCPPPLPTLPALLSKVSHCLSTLLLCCIPVSVKKGVDKEEGGKKEEGGTWALEREGEGKGGRRAPFFMRMPSAGSAERRTPAWLKP